MRIERHFTETGASPYERIAFATTKSEIRNPDGSVVFALDDIEVPAAWSQVAADVLAQKYFRKAGVPARLKRVEPRTAFLPSCGDRSRTTRRSRRCRRPSASARRHPPSRYSTGSPAPGPIGAGRPAISTARTDARAYYDEMRFMLARQIAAPNSPQWFNTGLHWAYGVDGPSQGHFYVDFETGKLDEVEVGL